MLKTPLCDLLGIEKPVFQGGMAWIADASLASAVSEAGGLGIIAAMNADANYDGEITLTELETYLSRRVMWYLNLVGDYVQTVRAYPAGDATAIFARTGTD